MGEFLSWRSYWDYSKTIQQKNRYIYNKQIKEFLKVVSETYIDRKYIIKKGTNLWRAQLGNDWGPIDQLGEILDEIEYPLPPSKMKPLESQASEGRVNPKGIPCLYLSTDKETAMSEVRPWMDSLTSVGKFKILKDLKLVDCSVKDKNTKFYFDEPDENERKKSVMSDIDEAFTRPITNNDNMAEYAPTQVLGELFKVNGFDGIVYSSALNKGKNIALFDVNNAKQLNCFLFRVNSISFEFSEAANPYFIIRK